MFLLKNHFFPLWHPLSLQEIRGRQFVKFSYSQSRESFIIDRATSLKLIFKVVWMLVPHLEKKGHILELTFQRWGRRTLTGWCVWILPPTSWYFGLFRYSSKNFWRLHIMVARAPPVQWIAAEKYFGSERRNLALRCISKGSLVEDMLANNWRRTPNIRSFPWGLRICPRVSSTREMLRKFGWVPIYILLKHKIMLSLIMKWKCKILKPTIWMLWYRAEVQSSYVRYMSGIHNIGYIPRPLICVNEKNAYIVWNRQFKSYEKLPSQTWFFKSIIKIFVTPN